jgi:RNA polymerase sigma-70 factor (ECF subfamily)
MLGSINDAQDIVQDARLRLHEADPKPDVEEAFLFRVVSNLCVDRLRKLKTERNYYQGPWLPDPTVTDSAEVSEIAEELTVAFMLVLERLTPAERIVYLLHEGFDYSFNEIAQMLNITQANARQRGSRARAKLDGQNPAPVAVPEQRSLLEAMLQKVAARDVEGLVQLLAPDAVAYTDGGGVVSAAIAPVVGAQRIAQVVVFLIDKGSADGEFKFEFVSLNGGAGLVVRQNGAVHSTIQIDVAHGRAQTLYITRNPHKMRHI